MVSGRGLLFFVVAFATACSGDDPRPLGSSCDSAAVCESGLCGGGVCLDPAADDDLDGLTNEIEVALGSDPTKQDSDGDGISDRDELTQTVELVDSDGDGIADINESSVGDRDGDCITDQYDLDDVVPSSDPSPMRKAVCAERGICLEQIDRLRVSCASGKAECVYADVVGYVAVEAACDGRDENCDGRADEGFPDRDGPTGDLVADCVDVDWDDDGALDGADVCPTMTSNTDSDGDGVGDACAGQYAFVFGEMQAVVVGVPFAVTVTLSGPDGPLPPFVGDVTIGVEGGASLGTTRGGTTAAFSDLVVTAPGELVLVTTSGGLAAGRSATFSATLDGVHCALPDNCESGVCGDFLCVAASCDDDVRNGDEAAVDCGGGCEPCAAGETCGSDEDCASAVCEDTCQSPSCGDLTRNGDETAIDCGGGCSPCADGATCEGADDCASGSCTVAGTCAIATCDDGRRNGGESAIDCGGDCAPCADGVSCGEADDCASAVCSAGACAAATCADGVVNGGESAIDCGGGCAACADGRTCGDASDCTSGVCAGTCVAARCGDGVKNGLESGIDCGGGSSCGDCGAGSGCGEASDCASGVCAASQCADVAATTFVASPARVVADGVATAELRLVVRAGGVGVGGVAVQIDGDGVSEAGVTDANGVFTVVVSSEEIGTATYVAIVGTQSFSAAVEFVAPAVDVALSSFTVAPIELVADGVAMATINVALRDARGQPLADTLVSLGSSIEARITPALAETDAQGELTATISAVDSGRHRISAFVDAVSLGTVEVVFLPGAASATTSTLTATPGALVADGAAAATVKLVLRDAHGNPIAGKVVGFSASGGAVTLDASVVTSAAGEASSVVRATIAGARTIRASVDGLTFDVAVRFDPGAASATTSTLVGPSAPVVADGIVTPLTFTLRDVRGNPIAGATVTFGAPGATVVPASVVTGADGVATVNVSSTAAGSTTVTATSGTVSVRAEVVFVAGAPSVAQSELSANPASVTAGDASAVTLFVRDAQGNPVVGQVVSFSASGAAVQPASAVTDADGRATTSATSSTAGAATITASFGGSLATQVTFVVGAPSAASSTLVVSPASVAADGVASATVTVTVKDGSGNAVVGQSVTLSAGGSGHVFGAAAGVTNASGVFATTMTSTVAGAKTVTAEAGVTKTAEVTFTVGAPSAATSTWVASPTNVAADGTTSAALTLTVLDAQGNAIAGQAVTLSASGSGHVFGAASGATNGSGVFATTITSTVAGVKTVTASFGVIKTADVTFTVGGPSAITSSLVASPTSVAADGLATATLTVSVRDQHDNAVVGQAVALSATGAGHTFGAVSGETNASGVFTTTVRSTVAGAKVVSADFGVIKTAEVTFTVGAPSATTSTLAASPASVAADGVAASTVTVTVLDANGNAVAGHAVALSATGSGHTFGAPNGETNANGVFTTTVRSTVAGVKTISADFGVIKTTDVTFTVGAPSATTSTFSASPTSVAADGTTTSTLTVTVLDSNNNPIASRLVSLSATGSGHTFGATSGNTNASGVFTTTVRSTSSGTKTITADFGVIKTTDVTFTVGAPSATTSTFTANPTSLAADGVATSTLTVTALDANNNPIANHLVTLSASGSGHTFGATSGNTNASGVFTTTIASTTAGTTTITADFGILKTTDVTFEVGDPNATTSTFVATPTTVAADGTTTSTLTVTVRDATNNPIASHQVSLSATGSGHTFGAPSGTTNAFGVFTTTIASTTAGTTTITADFGITKTTDVTFTVGAPSATTSTFDLTPSEVPADDVSTMTLTLTIRDTNGNPIAGQSISLGASGAGHTFGAPSGTTNASGVFTTSLRSNRAGLKTLTATFASRSLVRYARFTAPACDGVPKLPTLPFVAIPSIGYDLAKGDFDEDGYLDLAVPHYNSTLSIVLGKGDLTFAAQSPIAVGAGAYSVDVGDIDHDGHLDLITGNQSANTVSVLLGAGNGTFTAAAPVVVASALERVVLADHDGDGHLDVIVSRTSAGTVSIFRGHGNGTFAAAATDIATPTPSFVEVAHIDQDELPDLIVVNRTADTVTVRRGAGGSASYPLALGSSQRMRVDDVDNDGYLDIVVVSSGALKMSVLRGLPDHTFAASVSSSTLQSAISFELTDFNSDGYLDMVLAAGGSDQVTMHTGSATGAFTTRFNRFTSGEAYAVVVGDFDADGDDDFVSLTASRNLNVFENQGDTAAGPTVAEAETAYAGLFPEYVAHADLDHDVDVDLVTASSLDQRLNVLRNNGSGGFSNSSQYATSGTPYAVAIGDVDGDGHVDLVAANSNGTVAILRGVGDTTFGAATTVQAVVSGGATDLALGDLDGDGDLDLVVPKSGGDRVNVLFNTNGVFGGRVEYATATNARRVALGELDGLPGLDIAVTSNTSPGVVTVLVNNGGGVDATTFSARSPLSAGNGSDGVAVHDVNGDGRADVLTANTNSATLSVFTSLGNGNFASATTLSTGNNPRAVTVGDVNGDGLLDLVASSNGASVHYGTVLGAWAPVKTYIGARSVTWATVVDTDDDGLDDIHTTGRDSYTVATLRQRGCLECYGATVACGGNAHCRDLGAAFTCQCDLGFAGDASTSCDNVDECANGSVVCQDNASCVDESPGSRCDCDEGYTKDGFEVCIDIDECTSGLLTCGANATCIDDEGSAHCVCGDGYEGNATTGCTNIDECTNGSVTCGPNAGCVNDDPGAHCACDDGFEGDPLTGCNPSSNCPGGVCSLAAGDNHACAVHGDGSLWCWGDNGSGQLGLGDTAIRVSATRVGERTDWAMAAAGMRHSCALDTSGEIWCWGENSWGELGVGDTQGRLQPTPIMDVGVLFTAVFAGTDQSCGLSVSNELWCWGDNDNGEAGHGGTNDLTSPVRVLGDRAWREVAIGGDHKCAIDADGAMWCWGSSSRGQAALPDDGQGPQCYLYTGNYGGCLTAGCGWQGNNCVDCANYWGFECYDVQGCELVGGDECVGGSGGGASSSEPVQVGADTDWAVVRAAHDTTCALRLDGTRWCWGSNDARVHGTGGGDLVEPTQVDDRSDWSGLWLASMTGCGTHTDGALECWGQNSYLQLGVGTNEGQVPTPTAVQGGYSDWLMLATGQSFTCGVRPDGLWCWGGNRDGQLGIGKVAVKLAPTQVSAATDWVGLSLGSGHTCGIREVGAGSGFGTLWCAGRNHYGQLGIGGATSAVGLFAQESLQRQDWRTVAAGYNATHAITASGERWSWGFRHYLGRDSAVDVATPTRADSEVWSAMDLGDAGGCGLRSGQLWCYGQNNFGEVGDGSSAVRLTPVRVASPSADWTAVTVGSDAHVFGVRSGQLWAWGNNQYGVLGLGYTTPSPYRVTSPTRVGGDSDWARTTVGYSHACGLRTNGALWCWGGNSVGQVGTGAATQNYPNPVRVGADTFSKVAALPYTTCAIRNDATLWCWGNNSGGTVGDGTAVLRSTPVPIATGSHWLDVVASEDGASFCAIREDRTLWCWGSQNWSEHGDGSTQRSEPTPVVQP